MAGSREMLCPSSRGTLEDSLLIGVVTSHADGPRVVSTERALPVTPEILALAEPAGPSEVFRFASPCQTGRCPHFRNEACQLAVRSVELLDAVSESLPPCSIRPQCRWFRQEGAAICKRCPQVVTDQYHPSSTMIQIVTGINPAPAPAALGSYSSRNATIGSNLAARRAGIQAAPSAATASARVHGSFGFTP